MMSNTFKNWPWKLLSLILAIVLWFMIINYQDPEIKKKINNVKVKIINEDAITSKNKAVNYLEGTEVKLDVKGKRSVISKLDKEDIVVTADLSKVSITGAVDLDINLPLGVDLVNSKPSVMMISMEQIKSYLRTCTPFFEGEVEEGYVKLVPTLSPNQIEITGTQSKLGLISTVIVPINVDKATQDINLVVSPQILDSSGNEIEGLELSNDKIKVNLPVQKTKTVSVLVKPQGTLNSNLRLDSIKTNKSTIKVRGYKEKIDKLRYIEINKINLANLDENSKRIKVDLKDYLPEDISLMESDDVYVDVKIKKLIEKTITIYSSEIERLNTVENMNYSFADTNVKLIFKGTEEDLSSVNLNSLNPNVDFKDLTVGSYPVKLNLTLNNNIDLLNDDIELLVTLEEVIPESSSEINDNN